MEEERDITDAVEEEERDITGSVEEGVGDNTGFRILQCTGMKFVFMYWYWA